MESKISGTVGVVGAFSAKCRSAKLLGWIVPLRGLAGGLGFSPNSLNP